MNTAIETTLRFEVACMALGACRQDLQTPEQRRAYNDTLSHFIDLWNLVKRDLPMISEAARMVYNIQLSDYYAEQPPEQKEASDGE
jgi:hypothetical protein